MISRIIALVVVTSIYGVTNAPADPAADFYKGKRLNLIVGSAAGGDYDAWARMIARSFGRYIPGEPSIVAQNMPGAGGIRATNYMYNVAPRDGTYIAMTSRNAPFKAMTKDKAVLFDPTKLNWIGSPEVTHRVCVVSNKSPVQRAKEIFESELVVAGSGEGSALSTIPNLINRLLGGKMRLIDGYKSAVDAKLAVDRGEVHGLCQSLTQITRSYQADLDSGRLRVLFSMERQPIPGFDVPSIYEFTTNDQQRQVFSLFSIGVVLGRPMFAPQDVEDFKVRALRTAYLTTLDDPELRSEAERLGFVVTPTSGEEISRIIEELMKTPPEIRELAGNLGE